MTDVKLLWAAWPTAWGPMGAVAGAAGLERIQLPHYAMKDVRDLLAFEHPRAVEDAAALAKLIERTTAYFNGQSVGFADIACNLPPESSFTGKVLRACRTIPYGQVKSYTWLAKAAGNPDGARAAATAMSKNRLPLVIPCHRVVYAGGKLGGFSAPGGCQLKRRLQEHEKKHVNS